MAVQLLLNLRESEPRHHISSQMFSENCWSSPSAVVVAELFPKQGHLELVRLPLQRQLELLGNKGVPEKKPGLLDEHQRVLVLLPQVTAVLRQPQHLAATQLAVLIIIIILPQANSINQLCKLILNIFN